VIEELVLTPQRQSMRSTAAEVTRRCREAQLSAPPHANTVRSRIVALPMRGRLSPALRTGAAPHSVLGAG